MIDCIEVKYSILLNKISLLSLKEFVFFVELTNQDKDELFSDIMKFGHPKRIMEKEKIFKKANKNLYLLTIYEFINYSRFIDKDPIEFFKYRCK
ncbi:MAG: hypothetical protein GY830_08330 [Bacteroidetes bacterium]|nr:hypothetical protein [Bacteroidota bacterium]